MPCTTGQGKSSSSSKDRESTICVWQKHWLGSGWGKTKAEMPWLEDTTGTWRETDNLTATWRGEIPGKARLIWKDAYAAGQINHSSHPALVCLICRTSSYIIPDQEHLCWTGGCQMEAHAISGLRKLKFGKNWLLRSPLCPLFPWLVNASWPWATIFGVHLWYAGTHGAAVGGILDLLDRHEGSDKPHWYIAVNKADHLLRNRPSNLCKNFILGIIGNIDVEDRHSLIMVICSTPEEALLWT